jgi:hypothetical protein
MFETEPDVYPHKSQESLKTWRRIGMLDLNELHLKSPIDLYKELKYVEKVWSEPGIHSKKLYCQMDETKMQGLGREIVYLLDNAIYEG